MSESTSAGKGNGAPAGKTKKQRTWVPGFAAFVCMLIGLSDVLAVFKPTWHDKLHRINSFVPGTLTNVTITAYVITGLLLLLLSHGLRRRKRRAWQAVMALLALDIAIHFWRTPLAHIWLAVVSILLLATLIYFHDQFYAVGDPRTRWTAIWVFLALVIADIAIGLGYLSLGHLAQDYTFRQRVHDVVWELVGADGPVQWLDDRRSDAYHVLTSALGAFTLVMTVYLFLRPAQPRARLADCDAQRIRDLLVKQGSRDSLGYFALRDDKSVIWSPSGKAAICYRVVSGVMLAAGDPIGDPEAWPGAMSVFLTEAARHAWRPAVMGCSEQGAEVWCREGDLTALELGDEAIVNVADFSLGGRSMRNVRQMVSRVAKNGYVAEVRRVRDVPEDELTEVVRVADRWRGTQTERGFSMALGRIGAPGDEDCVLVTAREEGTLRAVLHFVPWGPDGLSLDLMRRDHTATGGLNDFMITESIKAAPSLGVKRISLNFAMFRAVLERGERIGAGPILKSWRNLLVFASRWVQIESLYKFNAKFSPVWEPRFFVFPGGSDAPRIAVAALQAEAFLVWPRPEIRRYARRLARALGLGRLLHGSRRRAAGQRMTGPFPVALAGPGRPGHVPAEGATAEATPADDAASTAANGSRPGRPGDEEGAPADSVGSKLARD
ncbi:MAG TPA: phosphatidylglycerol lysyltransferase domain-containing protein [Trebonia sp.]|jgi:lysyl-tRNA synthetase class 2|nr:phosphatidylglycerol lysyltransferase domain-containing protein [Trebonia sp.]